jgi:hypothetical protein
MSAHGIGPAWRADGDGIPDLFKIGFHALDLQCIFDLIGDVFVTINIGLNCEIIEPDPNFTHDVGLTCDLDLFGDLNPFIGMDLFCAVIVSGP